MIKLMYDTLLQYVLSLYFSLFLDRPDPPEGLNLVSQSDTGLTLVWGRPKNALPSVNTTYTMSIYNVTPSGNELYLERNLTTTSYSIHFLEEALLEMPCQPFQFQVTATNDAGIGNPAIYSETVPICKYTHCSYINMYVCIHVITIVTCIEVHCMYIRLFKFLITD